MSDIANRPDPDEPDAVAATSRAADRPTEPSYETEVTRDAVIVRRSPRYGRFLGIGLLVGAVVALVLTLAFPPNPMFDQGQVFGFLLLICAAVFAALGALVALVIDRSMSKRSREAIAEHESAKRSSED